MNTQKRMMIERYKRNQVIKRVGQCWRKPTTPTKAECSIAYITLSAIVVSLLYALLTLIK